MANLPALVRVVSIALLSSLVACGDDSSGSGASGPTGSGGATTTSTSGHDGEGGVDGGGKGEGGGGGAEESCAATLRMLQKDAYKESAGRSSELWPPHTTTVLEIVCNGAPVDDASQANHGTEPTATDAAGDIILVETATFTAAGSRAELTALLDAYRGCDCEDTTAFLSLDSLQGQLASDLLEAVGGYLQTNLTCPGTGLEDLLTALQAGDFETALAVFPTCSWIGGASFEDGLSAALGDLLAQSGELLGDYHVCNNDAAAQKGLFEGFVADGSLTCPGGDLCRGPLWFYAP